VTFINTDAIEKVDPITVNWGKGLKGMSAETGVPSKSPTPRKCLPTVRYSPDAQQLARLRTLQKTAIAAGNIDLAEQCEGEISALRQGTFASSFCDLKREFDEAVRRLITLYERRMSELEAKEEPSLRAFRQHINDDFINMQERHVHRLKQLQRAFASARLRESQRPVPEAEWLVQQSRFAAQIRDFEQAKQLLAQAAAVGQAECERRVAKLDLDLKAQTGLILQDQKKEMEAMVARLDRGVALIHTENEAKKATESETRDLKLIAELQKFTRRLIALAGPGAHISPHQRELEDLLVEIIESAALPVPKRLKKNPNAATRQFFKSPRRI
jgi:hypothetical protein